MPALSDAYVRCVQHQLAALGYDPGPIDGALGPRTRSAAEARRDNGIFLTVFPPEPLTRKSAFNWCRALARTSRRVAMPFVPAHDGPTVRADDDRMEEAARAAFDRSVNFLRSRYGIVLVSPTDIVISVRPSKVVSRLNTALGKQRLRLSKAQAANQRHRCNQTKQVVATAFPKVIAVCIGVDLYAASEADPKLLEAALWPVMMHEVFHKAQGDLSGAEEPLTQRKLKDQMGPEWLIEGCAVYFEERLIEAERWLFEPRGIRPFAVSTIVMRALPGSSKLDEIAAPRGFRKSEKGYQLGHLACHLLAQRHGPTAVINLWRRTGRGETMAQAFKAEFGIEMTDFTADFDERRRSLGAVLDYLDEGADNP